MFVVLRILRAALLSVVLLTTGQVIAEEPDELPIGESEPWGVDADFLFNYYDQDGDRSPVTGGEGTEDLSVVSPLLLLKWQINDKWRLNTTLGLDFITSASTDNMDQGETNMSGASRQDQRIFGRAQVLRKFGLHEIGVTAGYSGEYDYSSILGGLNWSHEFNNRNTALSADLRHFFDTIDLYGIDGVKRGDDSRNTTDLSLALTQVLGRNTLGSVELSYTHQSGFLSTPFHEVILAPTINSPNGERIAERLPSSRDRFAIGFRLNHAFTPDIVQRTAYRFYADNFDIIANALELETHFRLPTESEMWVFPIFRFTTQTESKYYGGPRTFTSSDEFRTSDPDLDSITSLKYGLGWNWRFSQDGIGWLGGLHSVGVRLTYYDRDDGLEAISSSLRFGWSF